MTKKNQRNRLEKLYRRIKDAKCGDQKQKKTKNQRLCDTKMKMAH